MMVAIAAVIPIALAIARDPTVAGIRAVVVTVAGTWLVATVALAGLLHDPSNLFTFFLFFLVIAPALSIPVGAFLATRLTGARGHLISAFMLGVAGWFAGVVAMLVIDEISLAALWSRYTRDYAVVLALPATYAALAALTASSLHRRT